MAVPKSHSPSDRAPGAPLALVFFRIIQNTFYMLSAQVAARLVSFAYILFLARWLPVEDFGSLNLALSLLVLADTAADVGLSRLALRELSRNPAQTARYAGALAPLRLITSGMAYGGVLAFIQLSGYPPEVVALTAIAGIGLFFTGLAGLLESVLHVRQRFAFVSAAHIALSLVQASIGIAILSLGGGAAAIAGTAALTNLVYLSIVHLGIRRLGIPVRPHVDVAFWLDRLRAALPYAAIAVVFVLSMRVELLVLGWFGSAVQLGVFGVALKFLEAALLVPMTLGTVLAPSFARYHAASRARLTGLYLWALRLVLLFAVPGSLTAMALAKPLMAVLLPDNSDVVGDLLRTMFAAFPFAAVHYLNVSLMLGSDRQRLTMMMITGLTATQVAISVLLVPIFGAHGAAAAFGLSGLLASLVSTWCVRHWFLHRSALARASLPPLAAGAVMAGLLLGWPDALGNWALPLALAVYAAIVAGLLALLPLRPIDASEAPLESRRDFGSPR